MPDQRTVAGRKLVTTSHICQGLKSLGISAGATVCLHASLSRLGFVIGAQRALVEGVLRAIGDNGTLMMPAFSGDLSDPAEWQHPAVPTEWIQEIRAETPPYDPERTPTRGIGSVAEYFRRLPGVLRSPHPQSSFSAYGMEAAALVDYHPLDNRFGPASPLGRLVEMRGYVLLLGAPRNTISLFHLTPHLLGDREQVRKRAPMLINGNCVWRDYVDIPYPIEWFEDAVAMLIDDNIAKVSKIGEAEVILLPAEITIQRVIEWRRATGR